MRQRGYCFDLAAKSSIHDRKSGGLAVKDWTTTDSASCYYSTLPMRYVK